MTTIQKGDTDAKAANIDKAAANIAALIGNDEAIC